jgi:hypothetical protein
MGPNRIGLELSVLSINNTQKRLAPNLFRPSDDIVSVY